MLRGMSGPVDPAERGSGPWLRLARRRAESDRGAGVLEFVLVFPLVLLIVIGVTNFGILYSQHLRLDDIRDGAVKALITDGNSGVVTCDGILASVRNQLSGHGLNPAKAAAKITQDGWITGKACGNTFQASSFGGNGNNEPCLGSFDAITNTRRSIIVEVQYVSDLAVHMPPFPKTMTLSSKGLHRCESS